MTRFYNDENCPLDLVIELRFLGYDVLTSYDTGQANQSISDENLLKFAHKIERVVITLNRIKKAESIVALLSVKKTGTIEDKPRK